MTTKSYERSINDKKFKKLRVLLVGNEEMVREVRDTLRQVGHDVITRETVEDAQELYEKELKKFDVVYHMVEVERVPANDTGIPIIGENVGSLSAEEEIPEVPGDSDPEEIPSSPEEDEKGDEELTKEQDDNSVA